MTTTQNPVSWSEDDSAWCGLQVMAWADDLARHTDHPEHLSCTYLTPAHQAAAQTLMQWMREAGFDTVRQDAIGNLIARYRAADAGSVGGASSTDNTNTSNPCIVVGSHYDTVHNGGRYDGRLGILLPLAIVKRLHARGERLPVDLELVAFSEEEGVRYGGTFLGSSAYAGIFDPRQLDREDANGIPMRAAIAAAGLEVEQIAQAAADIASMQHYFEVHIEQGPVLLDRGLPVGVVSAIAGSIRRRITLTGRASHSGTTPMDMRLDAACAAAEIVLLVEQRCANIPGLVGTVGQLTVPNGSVNVIPGRCVFSLDVRADNDATRDAALADIDTGIAEILTRRGITAQQEELMRVPAVPCSPTQRAMWLDAIAATGIPAVELPSGAGHDAMMMANVVPVSMLFVRCGNGGISHNPREIVDVADVTIAASVTMEFLARLTAD
ncbi:hydantoinase/carbamoylase family amidase [Pigmentiphaga aceris]|uniref:Hydantoinase/carbamoylase family amidase n=1 Tax=Pigmentiphaga aceris TaxID=1940612 RepID=A0A5C0B2T1_9BURK|nr:hydantoinase/carbamoylase family amidase [Pigmentiphaga aceris]QEI08176.1 hydantoinase/carbamoylase family amidase [Pigmentiphaga aceris]